MRARVFHNVSWFAHTGKHDKALIGSSISATMRLKLTCLHVQYIFCDFKQSTYKVLMLMYGFQCRVLQRLAVSTSKNMMACSRILLLNSFFYFVKFWKSRISLLKVLMVIMMCEPLCGKLVSCQVFCHGLLNSIIDNQMY